MRVVSDDSDGQAWLQRNKPQGFADGGICAFFIWWILFFANLIFGYGPFTQADAGKAMAVAVIVTVGWMVLGS
jgi:hypothetical protein